MEWGGNFINEETRIENFVRESDFTQLLMSKELKEISEHSMDIFIQEHKVQ